jgi:hypothetical protein
MLKVVEDIDIVNEEEVDDTSQLSLNNQFLKNINSGTQLLLRNLDGSNQFMVEIMNNAKLKKGQIESNPFRRSIYARGYQGFLTHDNGKPKIEFDNNNWITFDIASFSV